MPGRSPRTPRRSASWIATSATPAARASSRTSTPARATSWPRIRTRAPATRPGPGPATRSSVPLRDHGHPRPRRPGDLHRSITPTTPRPSSSSRSATTTTAEEDPERLDPRRGPAVGFLDRNFSNAGGSGVFKDVYAGGLYVLAENNAHYGYKYGPVRGGATGGTLVRGSTITLALGDDKTCTITNDDQPGTIIVQKITKPVDTGELRLHHDR